ncbi:MAG: MOSC domain-containing protein [Planctomycetota bacterium]
MPGVLEAIYVCPTAGATPVSVDDVVVSASGLAGDRYALASGTFSRSNLADGRAVSIIAAEALEELPQFADGMHRRNLVVRGVDLDALLGEVFRIGSVALRGVRPCPPCGYLSKLTGVDAKAPLYKRGGLRSDVVEPGTVRVGDAVSW